MTTIAPHQPTTLAEAFERAINGASDRAALRAAGIVMRTDIMPPDRVQPRHGRVPRRRDAGRRMTPTLAGYGEASEGGAAPTALPRGQHSNRECRHGRSYRLTVPVRRASPGRCPMGVSAKFLQVDGDAAEVAQVLAAMMGAPAPAATIEAAEAVPAVEPVVDRTATETRGRPAPDRPTVVPDIPTGEVLEGGPFEIAEDVPPAWRWVSDNGMTCHIRTQPGVAVSMCPLSRSKIGARRLHDIDIPFKATEVCEGCNSALVRSRRAS